MSVDPGTLRRIVTTTFFAAFCFLIGFLMATGWETPYKATARPQVVPAANLPLLDSDGNSPFIDVAEVVKPVVVNISAKKVIEGHPTIPGDPFDLRRFFGQPDGRDNRRQQMPKVTSGGSGIIIDGDGYILTNNHVVSDADEIMVKFADETELPAEVIGTDPETDVALIKVDTELDDNMVARIGDSDNIRIGEWAIAIGNPYGLDWTLTVGVISARGRSNLRIGGQGPSYQDFIQTDASINFGNSGGPLVNIKGEVIGVNTAINAQGQGLGFAIPINLAQKVVKQLRDNGTVERGYLGIFPTELDEMKREALGIDPEVVGVFVDGVQSDTPADDGGLRGGDVITKNNGKPVKDVSGFRFQIADFPPDSKINMTVWRSGKEKKMKFKLGARSEYLSIAGDPGIKRDQVWLGFEVAPTDGREGTRLGVSKMKGVLVVRIEPDSPAEGFLEAGDVITEIGNMEIESMDDYLKAVEKFKKRKKAIAFWVNRSGRQTFIPIRP